MSTNSIKQPSKKAMTQKEALPKGNVVCQKGKMHAHKVNCEAMPKVLITNEVNNL